MCIGNKMDFRPVHKLYRCRPVVRENHFLEIIIFIVVFPTLGIQK